MINNINDIYKHLDNLGLFHMKPGQDRMSVALEKLELLPLPYQSVQIVGTNGKGSTSSFLTSLAIEHGLKVGLYTSPHFVSLKERILYQNNYVSDEVWLKCAKKVYDANPELTYFEFLTVLSALIYKELQVDIVFFEAGLGGKFDATTALLSPVTVFTPIDVDHSSVLGSTIKEIAQDKANALNYWSKFAISAEQHKDAKNEIEKVCKEHNVEYTFIKSEETNYNLSLNGDYQQENAHLALATWRKIAKDLLDINSETEKEKKALKKAFIPGRLQVVSKEVSPINNSRIILDGGHNPHGLKKLLPSLIKMKLLPNYIIFTCMDDKEIDEILPLITGIAKQNNECKICIPTIENNPRAYRNIDLKNHFIPYYSNVFLHSNIAESLEYIKNLPSNEEKIILICGSLYLLAEFYNLNPQFIKFPNITD